MSHVQYTCPSPDSNTYHYRQLSGVTQVLLHEVCYVLDFMAELTLPFTLTYVWSRRQARGTERGTALFLSPGSCPIGTAGWQLPAPRPAV